MTYQQFDSNGQPKSVDFYGRSIMEFDFDGYSEKDIQAAVFYLPTDGGDCNASCPFLSICTLAGRL